ncbi:hypothetical protein D3C79_926440 [compost metagenome]
MLGVAGLDQLAHGVLGRLVGHRHRVVQAPALVLDVQAGAKIRLDRQRGGISQLLGKGAVFDDLFSTQGHGAGLLKIVGPASYPTTRAAPAAQQQRPLL